MKIIIFICLVAFGFSMSQPIVGQVNLQKGFNIYLLPDDIKPDQLASLDIKKLKPVGEPVISQRGMMSYLKDRHEIRFDYTGADRLRKLDVPTSGKSFIAFVGDEPIYTGAFWKSWSSQNFNGFAIDITNLAGDFPTVKIAEKYPEISPKIRFEDERQTDARSDKRIMRALEKAGVLYEELQLSGKCESIVSTLKRLEGYYVTFGVTEIHKGEFAASEITFTVQNNLSYNKLKHRLFDALEAKGLGWSSDWKFDAETEFFLKFERKIGSDKLAVVLTDFTKLTPAESQKPKMPAVSEIARVEFEPGVTFWTDPQELLKLLPRFVASEGTYSTKGFQQGSFVLKNGRVLRWWSSGKDSILLFYNFPSHSRSQLYILPDEKAEAERKRLSERQRLSK